MHTCHEPTSCCPRKPQQSFNLIAIKPLKITTSKRHQCLDLFKIRGKKWTFGNNTDVDNISLSYPGHEQSSSAHNSSGIPNLYQLLWMWSFWEHQLCSVNLLLQSSARLGHQTSWCWCAWSGAFKAGLRWCNLHLTKKIKYLKGRLLQALDCCMLGKALLLIIAKPPISAAGIVSAFDCTALGSKETWGAF